MARFNYTKAHREKRYQKFFINHLCNLFTGTINFVNIEKNIYFFDRTFID